MSGKTTEELKKLRAELIRRRRREAYSLRSAHQDEQLRKLAYAHLAVEAIGKVIGEGEDETTIAYDYPSS